MEGLGSFLLFALLFYFMMRFGCGAHMVHGHGGHGGHGHHGDVGGKFIDPVCGMEVDQDKGYGKMYQGEPYRFCSRSCLDKFDAEPEKFLNQHGGNQS